MIKKGLRTITFLIGFVLNNGVDHPNIVDYWYAEIGFGIGAALMTCFLVQMFARGDVTAILSLAACDFVCMAGVLFGVHQIRTLRRQSWLARYPLVCRRY